MKHKPSDEHIEAIKTRMNVPAVHWDEGTKTLLYNRKSEDAEMGWFPVPDDVIEITAHEGEQNAD